MADPSVPDVLDQSGRMRRLLLSLTVGAAVAAITYFVADSLAKPDQELADGVYTTGHIARSYRFVYYMTALFGALAFSATLATTNYFAKQKYRKQRELPPARVA